MTEDNSAFGYTRRNFLTTSGAVGAVALAGCTGGDDDGDTTDSGDGTEGDLTITWVMNPAEDAIDIEVQYMPVFDAIEEEFDVTIDGMETQNYSGTIEELARSGDGDPVMADTSPGAVPQLGPEEIDVLGMRRAFGSSQYFGTLVTTADSGITEVSDLEGERVVTNEIGSVSGGMAPLWILQDHGLDIGNAVDGGAAGDFEWNSVPGHDVAVDQLIQDDTIAAAGSGEFITVPHVPAGQLEDEFPDLAEISPDFADAGTREPELRMLETSPPLPRAPIVVNTDWEADIRFDIQEFMLELDQEDIDHDAFELAEELALDLPDGLLEDYNDPEASADPEEYDVDPGGDAWTTFDDHTLWFSGLEAADHETYEPIGDLADDLGMDFDDL